MQFQSTVFLDRESTIRAAEGWSMPYLVIRDGRGISSTAIHLGELVATDSAEVAHRQLDQLAVAIVEARAMLSPRVEPTPPGPDDPEDEPTDEPTRLADVQGQAAGRPELPEPGGPFQAHPMTETELRRAYGDR